MASQAVGDVAVDDEEFLRRIREKIERLAAREVEFLVDSEATDSVALEMTAAMPRVVFGSKVLEHPGLVRMAIEYVVACMKQGRELQPLEFQLLLRLN